MPDLEVDRWLAEVPGWLDREEALLLYTLARGWPGDGDVVEIGSYQGRSTVFLGAGVRDRGANSRPVIAIDTHEGSPEHQPGAESSDPTTIDPATGKVNTLPLFLKNVERAGVKAWVDPWRTTSTAAADRYEGRIRLLFVDADHAVQAVRRDVETWAPRLLPGGVLVLHDVDGLPGPTEVARELVGGRRFQRLCQANRALALVKVA